MFTLRLRNLPEFIQLLLHGRTIQHPIPLLNYLTNLSAVQSSAYLLPAPCTLRQLSSLSPFPVLSISFSCPLNCSLLAPPITTHPLSLVLSHSFSTLFTCSPIPASQWPLPAHLPGSLFIFFSLLPFFKKNSLQS